jgi:hypothetical protein
MALSDLVVRQAKATGKDYSLPDFDGLGLFVSATGSKAWHFRYYWASRQKRMSLGTYPEVSLREAREERDKARALLAKGINPKVDRKRKRQAVRLADENSFKAVYLRWLEQRKLELKEGRNSTLSQIQRIFKKDVLPRLGIMTMTDVRSTDLEEVLRKIEERDALTTAEKVRTWLNQLFRYAKVKVPGLESNPATDLDVVAKPKPPVVNNPYLRLPEIPDLFHRLRRYRGQLITQLGIRLLFLTGVRTGNCGSPRRPSSTWIRACGSSRPKSSSSCRTTCASTTSARRTSHPISCPCPPRPSRSPASCWNWSSPPRSTCWLIAVT